MAGWNHRLDGHEFGDGQGGLACCDSWGSKESDKTEWLNWTLNECAGSSGSRNLTYLRTKIKVVCIWRMVQKFHSSFIHHSPEVETTQMSNSCKTDQLWCNCTICSVSVTAQIRTENLLSGVVWQNTTNCAILFLWSSLKPWSDKDCCKSWRYFLMVRFCLAGPFVHQPYLLLKLNFFFSLMFTSHFKFLSDELLGYSRTSCLLCWIIFLVHILNVSKWFVSLKTQLPGERILFWILDSCSKGSHWV